MSGALRVIGGVSLLTVLWSAPAWADGDGMSLLHFRGGLLAAEQSGGADSFTLSVSWNPAYALTPEFGLEGQLGVAVLSTDLGGDFTAIDYEVLATCAIAPSFSLEAGGEAREFWSGAGGNANSRALSLNGVYALPDSSGFLKRVFFGYTAVLVRSLTTNVLRLGVEI